MLPASIAAVRRSAGVSASSTARVMVSMNRSLAAYTSSRTISSSPLK